MGFQRANIILVERVDIRGAFTGQKTSIERIEAVFYMGWKIIIGIQEKYLSPAAVRILSSTPDKLVLNVLSPGTLKIWTENSGKQELRNIQVKETGKMTIRK
jgi:hypothetical protein